MTLFLGFIYKD